MVGLPQYDAMNNAVFTRICRAPRARSAPSATEPSPPGTDANDASGATSASRVLSNAASTGLHAPRLARGLYDAPAAH